MNVSVRAANRRPVAAEKAQAVSLRQGLIVLGLITASALFYLYTEVRGLGISYELSQTRSTQVELAETGRRLRVELNNLLSPERLERAGARLGLAPAPPERVRVLP
ncbi:MAG: hypothetical protein K9K66_02405 [Desulfarculaceae bacterium]|nr:hypothetical protein [Desulfarculaceae bacterium]MCF8070900.1 hypothetical protein [Desulfarculaceae bacterium]MCF8100488.1 hypothetical protein [Desulfarculaceae bacterium]MCF8118095.1 hypothetical protein [Desulfarculaceae bacterium]